MRSLGVTLSCLIAISLGCIEKSGSSVDTRDDDPPSTSDAASSGATDGSTNMASDGGALSDVVVPPPPPPADGGQMLPRDPEPDPADPPPPPMGDNACERFCARMDMCLFPACDGLEDLVGPEFCGDWCRESSAEFLNESADLTCDGFVERIYSFADELKEFCSDDEPIPDECEQICEFAGECGFESAGCSRLCRSLGPEQRRCMLNADECGAFFRCIEDDRDDRPDPEEVCGNYCQRRSVCIFNECAPGTLPDEYTRDCFETCVDNPISGRDLQRFGNQTCEEIVRDIRDQEQLIDDRCEANEEEACQTLCADRILPCMGIEQDACLRDCQNWDEANHVCIVRSETCREVNECFGDPEGQARCRRSCDVLQTCMEEACPPRILPPTLTDGCTADCLNDPPSAPELDQWEALSCREVREIIYRGNRELRPFCEGGRDFRPTPDECVAFCDNALGACLGIGGRNFCLAGCASLTRDQYGCALEAQGACEQINRCLSDDAGEP